jgi:hypothetical protein
MTEWNRIPQMENMTGDLIQCGGECLAFDDGFNDVGEFLSNDTFAWAITWNKTASCGSGTSGESVETNTLFNTGQTWTMTAPPNFPSLDIFPAAVAIHEFGHIFGMDHESSLISIMNGTGHRPEQNVHGMYGGLRSIEPFPDDIQFVTQFYPSGSSATDVAATSFSLQSGNVVLWAMGSSLFGCPGAQIPYVFGLSNRGTASQNVQYKIYVSLDDALDANDTVVLTSNATVSAQSHINVSNTLTVPPGLTKGLFHTFIIQSDSSGSLSEYDETNNTTLARPRLLTKVSSFQNCP